MQNRTVRGGNTIEVSLDARIDAATVTGKVAFAGDKPAMKNISMDATPACARAHTTPQKSTPAANASGRKVTAASVR